MTKDHVFHRFTIVIAAVWVFVLISAYLAAYGTHYDLWFDSAAVFQTIVAGTLASYMSIIWACRLKVFIDCQHRF